MNNWMNAGEPDVVEQLLMSVRKQVPVVGQVLSAGDQSIAEYLQQVCRVSKRSYQPCSDIADVIYEYLTPLLGEKMAEKTAADFIQHPVALTTNHHGVDFFAQSVQGSLMLGLAKREIEGVSTIPVFSCANIPLNNLTYPRGALLYDVDCKGANWPLKVPFFASKLRRQLVARVKGLTPETLQSALKRIRKLDDAEIRLPLKETLKKLIEEDYLSEDVQAQQSYAAQSVILNRSLWNRLFSASANMPELITIELEKLAEGLLSKDLLNQNSLVYQLFSDQMIGSLYQRLDRVSGCWDKALLEQRWVNRNDVAQLQASGSGTFCFWGVDDRCCRIPLMLIEDQEQVLLCGCDDRGKEYRFSLDAESVRESMRLGQLLPSIFSCYLTIALARGVTCLGGYYQADYLPEMQAGVADLLNQINQPQKASDVSDSYTNGYLSGMQAIMINQGGGVVPAGPVEILTSGPVTASELDFISEISVCNAHKASLAETIPDVMPVNEFETGWLQTLACAQYKQLSEKVVLRQITRC